MTNAASDPPTHASEVFYRSVRTYRNRRAFTGLAICLVCATPFLLGVIHHLAGDRPGSRPIFFYLGAALFLFPACVLAWSSIRNLRERIEINQEGVRLHRYSWRWDKIESLAPKKVNFATKYFIRVGLRAKPHTCVLQPDEPLTSTEYNALVARLRPFLEARYPSVSLKTI